MKGAAARTISAVAVAVLVALAIQGYNHQNQRQYSAVGAAVAAKGIQIQSVAAESRFVVVA